MFGALFNPAVIWVLIPIAAIVTGFLIKWKKLDLENDRHDISNEQFRVLQSEIAALRQRVESLEGRSDSETTVNSGPRVDISQQRHDTESEPHLKNMLRSS
ncbi:MAG TPA: hypothetical protein VKA08_05175 [Balneolales bacterium]|nr:hypothetical protein [Balneolales bacterium]